MLSDARLPQPSRGETAKSQSLNSLPTLALRGAPATARHIAARLASTAAWPARAMLRVAVEEVRVAKLTARPGENLLRAGQNSPHACFTGPDVSEFPDWCFMSCRD